MNSCALSIESKHRPVSSADIVVAPPFGAHPP
jgi:hypothetical protein